LVDAQSFPYVSKAYPQLSAAGAWHPNAVYTADDITSVINYAYARGIRVVPELDGPGHAAAWGFDLQITTDCPQLAHNINNINLSPA
jgi:hexosaminidase